jgi:hypothetical protein
MINNTRMEKGHTSLFSLNLTPQLTSAPTVFVSCNICVAEKSNISGYSIQMEG